MMKRAMLSVVFAAACLPVFSAVSLQSGGNNIDIKDTRVERVDNSTVIVAFRIEFDDRVTVPNRSLIIVPSLSGAGGNRSNLPPIIVRGERSDAYAENRALDAAGVDGGGRFLAHNGRSIDYHVSIPWQDWMEGSQLTLSGLNAGGGRTTEVEMGLVASGLLTRPVNTALELAVIYPEAYPTTSSTVPSDVTPVVSPPAVSPSATPVIYPDRMRRPLPISTVGDELSSRLTFVEPLSRYHQIYGGSVVDEAFDYNMPLLFGTNTTRPEDETGRYIEMTREGALCIKFERDQCTINRDMGDNNQRLVDLISSVRILGTSPNTRIAQVVVTGFCAPDGIPNEKETLALERANILRDFLTANSGIDPSVISTYSGSVDWQTLRILVSESNMPEKYRVLEIIDNVPAWGTARNKGRMAQLMALNGGEEFRYIRELFFPKLRQTGAYVKIYYENVR